MNNLNDKNTSIEFYEERFSKGYMDDWEVDKKQRVFGIIVNLNLPRSGNALDFGCGTGVFTKVIKEALPNWNVYGTDISLNALEKAKGKYSDCFFFPLSEDNLYQYKFEFVFTHHVLEHVYDLSEVINTINNFLKDSASCLHILPCGNPGSMEYNICNLVKDGINHGLGDSFFFEISDGHIRRLNTDQMNMMLGKYGFTLKKEYYSNQFYGAIEWITMTGLKRILLISNPFNAVSLLAFFKMVGIGTSLLSINILRRFFYPLSLIIDRYIKLKAKQEWQLRKSDKRGSAMYLYYTR